MRIYKLILLVLLLAPTLMHAQALTVTGQVTDKKTGEPISFANIAVANTTRGTTTDMEGNYSLQVNQHDTLIVTMVGMIVQRIAVRGEVINIALEEAEELVEEFGPIRPVKESKYAVSTVTEAEIKKGKKIKRRGSKDQPVREKKDKSRK